MCSMFEITVNATFCWNMRFSLHSGAQPLVNLRFDHLHQILFCSHASFGSPPGHASHNLVHGSYPRVLVNHLNRLNAREWSKSSQIDTKNQTHTHNIIHIHTYVYKIKEWMDMYPVYFYVHTHLSLSLPLSHSLYIYICVCVYMRWYAHTHAHR